MHQRTIQEVFNMGMVAPAMAVVGTVASLASNASQVSANNRAISLQQQANNRALKLRLMGLDMQEAQLIQQAEQEKLAITSQAELAQLSVEMQAIQRNIQTAQQLAGIDVGTAQRVLDSVAKQYEVARQAFLRKQQVETNRASMLEEAGNQYKQLAGTQQQVVDAIKQGDLQLAAMLSRQTGSAYTSDAQATAVFQQEQFAVMKQMLEATQTDERLQQDLLLNSQYADFLNRAIEASLAANSAKLSAEEAGYGKAENSARKQVGIADKGSQRIELLSQALIPQARDTLLRQTDIDTTYASEAIANSRLEAQFGNYSNNVNLERGRASTNWIGGLAAIGQAAIPLVGQLNFFNQRQQVQPRPTPIILNDYHYTG